MRATHLREILNEIERELHTALIDYKCCADEYEVYRASAIRRSFERGRMAELQKKRAQLENLRARTRDMIERLEAE